MTRVTSMAWIAAALLVAGAAVTPAQAQTSGRATSGGSNVCCINNFRFAGTCAVTLSQGQSCYDVLAYLNNLSSAGQQYCGNTTIRGGWSLVPCDSGGGGRLATPGTVTATEPTTAPVVRRLQPINPTSTGATRRGGATFITPVDPSAPVRASEPELINL